MAACVGMPLPGNGKYLRFAYQPTNKGDVWGLFTDGMSAEALDTTWSHTIGRMLKEMTPEEKKGLTGIEDDSWEGGETTWTKQFPQKFKELRNYDLITKLPALVGITIGDSVQSRRDPPRLLPHHCRPDRQKSLWAIERAG
jgi:hypothetical protein